MYYLNKKKTLRSPTRRNFLKNAGLILGLPLAGGINRLFAGTVKSRKPNIVFIISDDLMKQTELYGYKGFKTPELNKLAKEALLFDRAYCQYPLCGPSRASMMTGLYPSVSGITWNQGGKAKLAQKKAEKNGTQTLPAFFKSNGYTTVGGGKIYHNTVLDGKEESVNDFNVVLSSKGKDGKKKKVNKKKMTLITEASDHEIEDHKDGRLAHNAVEWLDNYKKNNSNSPFFMTLGFKKPHSPFSAPKQFFDKYKRESIIPPDIKAPDNILKHYSLSGPGALLRVHADTLEYTGETLPEAKKKEIIHGYSACVSFTDHLAEK